MAVLQDLTCKSNEELIAMIQAMRSAPRRLTMKVTEKGALSVYGLGRFPVTLYRGQWERLLDEKTSILQYILANADVLSVKA